VAGGEGAHPERGRTVPDLRGAVAVEDEHQLSLEQRRLLEARELIALQRGDDAVADRVELAHPDRQMQGARGHRPRQ